MSFGDPQHPSPQPPMHPSTLPDRAYPQRSEDPFQAHVYAQSPTQPGYPPQHAHGVRYSASPTAPAMPGIMVTARIFLYLVSAVQVLAGVVIALGAAVFNSLIKPGDSDATLGHLGAGMAVFLAVVFFAFATLSIVLGLKFAKGGPHTRVTTAVYGCLGILFGLLLLIGGAQLASGFVLVWAVLWIAFGSVITASVLAPSGTRWFNGRTSVGTRD